MQRAAHLGPATSWGSQQHCAAAAAQQCRTMPEHTCSSQPASRPQAQRKFALTASATLPAGLLTLAVPVQVRFSSDSSSKNPPTAVLVHGILGSGRNLQSFARRIVEVSSSGLRTSTGPSSQPD